MSLLAKVNPKFVNIEGGTFKMGSMQWDCTQPITQVTLSPFQMMDAPVTVAQFKAYIEWGEATGNMFGQFIRGREGQIVRTFWGPSKEALQKKAVSLKAGQLIGDIRQFVPTWQEYVGRFDDIKNGATRFLGDNKPVVAVYWYEAAAFCAAIGCELPTETQHEYAARAGRGDVHFGTDSGEMTTENSHSNQGSSGATVDVKSYAPNPWGLYDMQGNVFDWCSNWPSENYQGLPSKDQAGPLDLNYKGHAMRGGSFHCGGGVAARGVTVLDFLTTDIGFRAVRRQG